MDFGPIGPSAGCDGGGGGGGDDSLRGLVFGKKIYFEDGSGGGNKALPARKGRGVLQGGGGGGRQQQAPTRPRCQVEGCEADLSGVKAYYCRHKVCGMHSKAPKVIVGGIEQRFCQQCSRFHQLTEFDQGKRSCRRRLAGHNERRRKPPSGPFNSRYGQYPRSFHEPSRFRSFLMDFSYPKHGRDICSDNLAAGNQWHEVVDAPWNAVVPVLKGHPYSQGCPGQIMLSSPELPPGECLAGALDGSCALSLLSSTQTWGSNTSRGQAPSISSSSSFNPFSNNYMANSWGSRGPGSRSHSQETEPLNEPGDRAHFSGELELALQGSRQYLEHGYGHSDHMIHHWSL